MPCGVSLKGVIYKMKLYCIATWIQRVHIILMQNVFNTLNLLNQFLHENTEWEGGKWVGNPGNKTSESPALSFTSIHESWHENLSLNVRVSRRKRLPFLSQISAVCTCLNIQSWKPNIFLGLRCKFLTKETMRRNTDMTFLLPRKI